MTAFHLDPHAGTPPQAIRHVNVSLTRRRRSLDLFYVIEGPTDHLVIPPAAKPCRTDELWRTTCLEAFFLVGEHDYIEFNFSPSAQWAAYHFESYRNGMAALELDAPPHIGVSDENYALFVWATIDLPPFPINAVGLSAVIEETDGSKSFWALAHPDGGPDFHDRDCFVARLPAPERP